jgi:hypothetical protein
MLHLHPLHLLLLALGLILSVDDGFAIREILLNLRKSRAVRVLNPGVAEHVCHLGAGCRVELDQTRHQVLEIVREIVGPRLVLAVCLPEKVRTVGTYQLVERIAGLSAGERRVLSIHDKQDDCCSE